MIEAVKEFDIAKAITAVTALVDDGKKAYSECLGKKWIYQLTGMLLKNVFIKYSC